MINPSQLQNMAIFPEALLDRHLEVSEETGDSVEHGELPTDPPKDNKGFVPGGQRPVSESTEGVSMTRNDGQKAQHDG
jgi:hypothetical protein